MKKFQKKLIKRNIVLLYQMHKLFYKCIACGKLQEAFGVLQESQQSAIEIGNTIEKLLEDSALIINRLENYCEEIYQVSEKLSQSTGSYELQKRLDNALSLAEKEIDSIECGKLEIVFLPYKASMWTALESIWKAAVMDEECSVEVIPIPYYDLNANGDRIGLNYEGNLFPKDVVISDYQKIDMEHWQPDVIYVHNPYDEHNNLTRVPEEFYSRKLKERTGCLVYSPYAMESRTSGKKMFQLLMPGYRYADKIIVQNKKMEALCQSMGIPQSKLVTCGSPKVDAIVNLQRAEGMWKWEDSWRIREKKVFLLNIHLTYFTGNDETVYAMHIWLLNSIIDLIEQDEEVALIVRPHPLLREWITKTFPHRLEDYETMIKRIHEGSRCILDDTGSYLEAFAVSDAMISTFSSLITEYMVTNKPILIIQNEPDEKNMEADVVNYSGNYFRADKNAQEILSVKKFLEMIKKGEDPLKNKRQQIIAEDFGVNAGNIGSIIHQNIKEYCESDCV